MIRILCKLWKDESGSELVEFALAIWIWIGMVFLILYGAFAIYAEHFVGEAAHDGARYAMVRGSTWNGTSCASSGTMECDASSTDVTTFIENRLPPGMQPANLTVSTTWPGTTSSGTDCDTYYGSNSPNCVVKVQVRYVLDFPYLSAPVLTLSNTSEMTISQ
jgi:Flp pilus assembly protein TadG